MPWTPKRKNLWHAPGAANGVTACGKRYNWRLFVAIGYAAKEPITCKKCTTELKKREQKIAAPAA